MRRARFWTASVVAFAVFLLTPIVSALACYDIVLFYRTGLDATISQTLTDYAQGIGCTGAGLLWTGTACLWSVGNTILVYHFLGWWMLPTRTRRLIEQARQQARSLGQTKIERKLDEALQDHTRR